jgi:hypothetical protein
MIQKISPEEQLYLAFHPFPTAQRASAALRRRRKQLKALGIAKPKKAIGSGQLTPLGSTSARGQRLATGLRCNGIELSNEPIEESVPGDFHWLDSLLWRPPGFESDDPLFGFSKLPPYLTVLDLVGKFASR